MNKVIKQNGKYYQECQVHLIETKTNQAEIYKYLQTLKSPIGYKLSTNFTLIDKQSTYTDAKYQHLYVTSDEEIIEGDWIFGIETNTIEKANYSGIHLKRRWKKIISTTDESLKIWEERQGERFAGFVNLPKPSKQFIQKYITEYNKGNVITKCLVEIGKAQISSFEDDNYPQYNWIIKIDSHNCITIKPVEEKSYTRAEVVELFEKFIDSKELLYPWIEQNL